MVDYRKIEHLRDRYNLTQVELANNIGITQPTLNAILNGRKQPSVAILKKISDIFNVKMEDLLLAE
jgi:putative transcriptional regulator